MSRFYVTWLQQNFNKLKKKEFLQIVKVKGKTQDQGQIKVKGQGHMNIFTILYANVAETLN